MSTLPLTGAPVGSIYTDFDTEPPEMFIRADNDQWILCNGQTLLTDTHLDLFDAIRHSYGGDIDHFNIPNLQTHVIDSEIDDYDRAMKIIK